MAGRLAAAPAPGAGAALGPAGRPRRGAAVVLRRAGGPLSVYGRLVLPRVINLTMRHRVVTAERARLIPLAEGAVLEIGAGSGLNLPLYGPRVSRLWALDPSPEIWRLGRARVARAPFPVEYLCASAGEVPLPDGVADAVVSTWTLCTVPDVGCALAEMRRVLRPGGQVIFIEHGRAPDARVRAWQDRLNPLWRRLAGGCNLNRPMDRLIREAGFVLDELDAGYGVGPRPFAYLYRGRARRAP